MIVAVFGRGKSLERYTEDYFDRLYLVNNFNEEICWLKLFTNSARKIIHVCGRKGSTVLSPESYERLKIERIVVNAKTKELVCNHKRFLGAFFHTRPEYMEKRGYPGSNWKEILKGNIKPKDKENGHCWPTTGLFAVDLALVENNPTEIHLYGFDMYREDYLVKSNRPHQKPGLAKYKCMKLYLEKLAQEFDQTKFFCYSDIQIGASNWNTL